jgi:hypothetical protein
MIIFHPRPCPTSWMGRPRIRLCGTINSMSLDGQAAPPIWLCAVALALLDLHKFCAHNFRTLHKLCHLFICHMIILCLSVFRNAPLIGQPPNFTSLTTSPKFYFSHTSLKVISALSVLFHLVGKISPTHPHFFVNCYLTLCMLCFSNTSPTILPFQIHQLKTHRLFKHFTLKIRNRNTSPMSIIFLKT